MFGLSSTADLVARLAQSHRITLSAYTLHGETLHALETAAQRGARVVVRLEGTPHDDPHGRLAAENGRVVSELRAAGADAQLKDPIHAKTIEADGTVYLDDKNFGKDDLVLRTDDRADVKLVARIKHEALRREADLLRTAGPVAGTIVESESFGRGNVVYSALDELGKRGCGPRLLVCGRELRANATERLALERLCLDGVHVRVTANTDKLAVAGDGAWIGSANATVAFGAADLPDWGLSTKNPAIVKAVQDRIETQWAAARPFQAPA